MSKEILKIVFNAVMCMQREKCVGSEYYDFPVESLRDQLNG